MTAGYGAVAAANPYGLVALRSRRLRYWWAGFGVLVLAAIYLSPVALLLRQPSLASAGTTETPLPTLAVPSVLAPLLRVPKVHRLAPLPAIPKRHAVQSVPAAVIATPAPRRTRTIPVVRDVHTTSVPAPQHATKKTDAFANAPVVEDDVGTVATSPSPTPAPAPGSPAPATEQSADYSFFSTSDDSESDTTTSTTATAPPDTATDTATTDSTATAPPDTTTTTTSETATTPDATSDPSPPPPPPHPSAAPWTVSADDGSPHTISAAVAGSDISVTIDDVAQSQDLDAVTSVAVIGGDDDDTFTIDPSLGSADVPISFDGGAGTDTLDGPSTDSRWTVTGTGSGTVDGVAFSNFENLTGAANNDDTFDVQPGGSVSGVVDGGAGGDDTIAVDGGTDVVSTITGPQSGTVARDADVTTYTEMEPTTIDGAANGTVTIDLAPGTTSVDVEDDGTPGDGTFVIAPSTGEEQTITNAAHVTSLAITGPDTGTTFTVSGVDSAFGGSLLLTGGSGADTFQLSGLSGYGGAITITGGSGGNDTLELGNSFGHVTLSDSAASDRLDFSSRDLSSDPLTMDSSTTFSSTDGSSLVEVGTPAASVDTGSGWSLPTLVDHSPPYGSSPGVSTVSCPSTSLCVAIDGDGNVFTTTDPGDGASADWQTSASIETGVSGLSCPSVSLCVAISGLDVITSTDPGATTASWTSATIDPGDPVNPSYSDWLQGVSCSSTSLCVAVDLAGNVLSSTDPAGGASAWSSANLGETLEFTGVSCASSALCVGVGQAPEESGGGFSGVYDSFVASSTAPTGGARAWSVDEIETNNELYGVSCPSASLCVAVDATGDAVTSTDPIAGGWSAVHVTDGPSNNYLRDVTCASTSLCVALDYLGGDVLTSTDAGAGSWSVADGVGATRDQFGTQYGEWSDASCPSTELCLASDDAGNVVTSDDPTGGAAAWTTLALVGTNALKAVSCPSPSFCAAIDDSNRMLTTTDPGGDAWTSVPGLDYSMLQAIACPAASLCVAVDDAGDIITSTSPGDPGALTVTYGLTNSSALDAVSCPSTSFCMAVGDEGTALVSDDPADGASWTLTDVDVTGFSRPLVAVSCVSSALCVAVDDASEIVTYGPYQGSEPAECLSETGSCTWSVERVESDGGLTSISCPSADLCVAAGGGDDVESVLSSADPEDSSLGNSNAQWSTTDLPGGVVDGISCPSASFCVAVDNTGNALVSTDPGASSPDWSAADVDGANDLASVSCPSAAFCAAVDGIGDAVVFGATVSVPVTWQQLDAPNPDLGNDALNGVSCLSASDCIAVGGAFAVRFDGAGWTPLGAVAAPDEGEASLLSVSCATESFCVAVGYAGSGSSTESLAEIYDGSDWQLQTLPADPGEDPGLSHVSCASATDCMAVGDYYDGSGYSPYSFHWDGSAWAFDWMPDEGENFSIPDDVSCSGGTCMAVGSSESPGGDELVYAAEWDGGSWSFESGAQDPGGTNNTLGAVSCLSATSCVAAGEMDSFYGDAGDNGTMVQIWSGTSWTLVEDTSDAAQGFALDSISCTSARDCTAVGTNRFGDSDTFAEHFDGSSLTVETTPDPGERQVLSSVSCTSTCLAVGHYSWGSVGNRALALTTGAGPFEPGVDDVEPAAGPLDGGAAVTIRGVGFVGATAVEFGSLAASSYTIVSDDEIDAVAPPCGCSSEDPVDVSIATPNGMSTTGYDTDVFDYASLPVVTGVAPSSGPVGASVEIDGTGFDDAAGVWFGSTAADGFTIVSDTEIDATVPSESGMVDVTVETLGGTSASGAADEFTIVPPPEVTGVTPASGPDTGGTVVAILGSGFTGATDVEFYLFDDEASIGAAFTIVSDTEIDATTPSLALYDPTFVGQAEIAVTGPGGTSAENEGDVFSYTLPNSPPTAAFTSTVAGSSVSFDAGGSSDSDGTVVSYAWDFGDGQTGSGEKATHTYASAGTYSVTLTVTDDGGATGEVSNDVTVAEATPFDVVSAGTEDGFEVDVRFDAPPNALQALSMPSYSVPGLTLVFGSPRLIGDTVEIGTSQQEPGQTYTITVSGVTRASDGATLTNASASFTYTAPFDVVGATSVDPTHVAVSFDAPPDPLKALTLENYSAPGLTLSGTPVLSGDTVTLTTSPQAAFTYTVMVARVTRASDGQALTTANATFTGTAPFDVVGAASVDATTLSVTFDAAPDPTEALTLSNYGVTGLSLSGTPTLSGDTVTITTSAQGARSYTVAVSGVTRADDGEPLTNATASFTYVPPFDVMSATSLGGTELAVTFDSAPDPTEATTLSSYAVPGLTLSGTPTLSGDTVTIPTSAQAAQSYTVTVSGVTRASDGESLTNASATFAGSVPNQPPTASFVWTHTDGLTMLFDGTGSTDPDGQIVSYAWDFGDGSSGTGATPSHAYATAGTYTVALTVTDDDGATDTQSAWFIDQPAFAIFTATPSIGVNSLVVTFSPWAQSWITSFAWDFGDGSTDSYATDPYTDNSVTHTYATAGTYQASLTVTAWGVTDTQSQEVTVVPPADMPPTASFASSVNGLSAGFDASASTDTDGNVVSFAWDFGDGESSTGASRVAHTYASVGTYRVKLTVTDDLGAVDSVSHDVVVDGLSAAFDSATNGDTISVDAAPSSALGIPITSYVWDFGDGSTATGADATHQFECDDVFCTEGGDLEHVTLTVTDGNGVTASSQQTLTVHPLYEGFELIGFTTSVTGATVSFQASSEGLYGLDEIDAYNWDFGDGSTGSGEQTTHTYAHEGTYSVQLAEEGSNDEGQPLGGGYVHSVTIARGTPAELSVVVSGGGTVLAPGIDCGQTCEHSYAGGNLVILTAEPDKSSVFQGWSGSGCSGTGTCVITITGNTAVTATFVANQPPTASFTVSTNGLTASVDASASGDQDGRIESFGWDFGDGETGYGVAATHAYAASGTYTVTLTVTDDLGATGTTTEKVTVPVNQPPVAYFDASVAGAALSVNSWSTDPDGTIVAYAWDFGDGSTASGVAATHTYLRTGTYDVTLTVTDNDGATDSTTRQVAAATPTASFTATGSNLTMAFDASGSNDHGGSFVKYVWDFGDGTKAGGETTTHTYATEGTYTVQLTVTDGAGQRDSVSHTIPIPDWLTAAFNVGVNGSAISVDASPSTVFDGAVATYTWDFGDGSSGTGAETTHAYQCNTEACIYDGQVAYVTLTITDRNGVAASAWHAVSIPGTASDSFGSIGFTTAVSGSTVSFQAGAGDGVDEIDTYNWSFGDGSTGSGSETTHTYAYDGDYSVTLSEDGYSWERYPIGGSYVDDVLVPAGPLPTLSVAVAGAGTVDGFGIDCGVSCQKSYTGGRVVTLTAHPLVGSEFTGWGGSCSGTDSCTLTITGDTAVTATFAVTVVSSTPRQASSETNSLVSTLAVTGGAAPPPAGVSVDDLGSPVSKTVSAGRPTTISLASATVSIPADALPTGTTVSVYPVTTRPREASLIPPRDAYIASFVVSWRAPDGTTPIAGKPVTLTIKDPSIEPGDTIYELTSTGLRAVGNAKEKGIAVITFTDDPLFVVAAVPAVSVGPHTVRTSRSVEVTLGCGTAPCQGSARVAEGRSVLAVGTFKLSSDQRRAVGLTLTAAGRKLLAGKRRRPTRATLTVTVAGGSAVRRSITLKPLVSPNRELPQRICCRAPYSPERTRGCSAEP